MNMRKIFKNVSLAMLLLTSLANNMINQDKKTIKVHAEAKSTFDEFTIAGFVNYYDFDIDDVETQTTDLARSGMNWIDRAPNVHDINGDHNGWKQFNELCQRLNIYFSVQPIETNSLPTDEVLENTVAQVRNLDRCIGYYVKDEPSASQFEAVATTMNKYIDMDPTRFPYVNLFPNYAGAANLGGSYEDYVNKWISTAGKDNLEYLYFDHYPFTQFEDIRASYFSDVEIVRKAAFDNGRIKTGGYTQMGWWNGMREPSIAEARWSMNSLLTYGMKSISHFCWVAPKYVAPPEGEGMRDFVLTSDGRRTKLYEPMQKLNWQTRQLGPELMKIDVAHAYHNGNIPTGTEALPKSFLIQPSSVNDNLIMSICYSKDDSEKYVMIFNKNLEGINTFTFNVDETSGLESLTWFKPDSFDTLPDYTKDLAPAEQVTVDIVDNQFSLELEAGEMRLFKLNGDISIKEPLGKPRLSVKSGTHLGEQYVEITSPDEGAEIYYTTDGSYPTYASKRYKEPIKIGNKKDFGLYNIKAIAIRGDEISDVVTGEYIISDGATNVALGKPITFTGATEIWQGSSQPKSITDGGFDPFNCYGSIQDNPCFAIVDLQEEYTIDKVVVKAWHDWEFADVIIQTAEDSNFTQGVFTIYNSDTDNSVGCGAGSDGLYIENPNGGHTFKFAPTKARYIRFYNCSARNEIHKSMWEEIQAHSYYDAGENLLANSTDWRVTGGGNWINSSGSVSQKDGYDQTSWNRSYTYTKKKYKNFILEGKFKMNVGDPGAWGYVGFGMYKTSINSVQGDVDQGIYAAVEPRGRALLWNGAKPELGPEDANIIGYSLGTEFSLRVVSIDDMISISVDGKPVMYVRDERLNREAGYISIHGGLVPVDVSYVSIKEVDDTYKPIENQECLKTGGETKIAVDRFTTKEKLLEKLPSTLSAVDTSGNSYNLEVEWNLDNYNMAGTGFVTLEGKYKNLPNTLVNYYDVKAIANVFLKSKLDTNDLQELVNLAKTLDPNNFTEDSYKGLLQKIEASEDLMANEYLSQSDIGVGNFMMYDAIYRYLVSTVDRASIKTAINDAIEFKDSHKLTNSSKVAIGIAIDEANEVYNDVLATPEDVKEATNKINRVVSSIQVLEEEKEPISKPDIDLLIEATKSNAIDNSKGCKGSVSTTAGFMAALLAFIELKRKKNK